MCSRAAWASSEGPRGQRITSSDSLYSIQLILTVESLRAALSRMRGDDLMGLAIAPYSVAVMPFRQGGS